MLTCFSLAIFSITLLEFDREKTFKNLPINDRSLEVANYVYNTRINNFELKNTFEFYEHLKSIVLLPGLSSVEQILIA